MFGSFFDDALDAVGDVVEGAVDLTEKVIDTTVETAKSAANHVEKKIDDFIDDPVGETVKQAARPVVDAVDIIDGLTEGELRTKAALSLGAEVASGMAVGELIEWYETIQ